MSVKGEAADCYPGTDDTDGPRTPRSRTEYCAVAIIPHGIAAPIPPVGTAGAPRAGTVLGSGRASVSVPRHRGSLCSQGERDEGERQPAPLVNAREGLGT